MGEMDLVTKRHSLVWLVDGFISLQFVSVVMLFICMLLFPNFTAIFLYEYCFDSLLTRNITCSCQIILNWSIYKQPAITLIKFNLWPQIRPNVSLTI